MPPRVGAHGARKEQGSPTTSSLPWSTQASIDACDHARCLLMLLQGAQATPTPRGSCLPLNFHPAHSEQLQQGVQHGQKETQPASQGHALYAYCDTGPKSFGRGYFSLCWFESDRL